MIHAAGRDGCAVAIAVMKLLFLGIACAEGGQHNANYILSCA